uniref:dnaJ homolog subfamily C member 11 n=1 Tax=Ciona intestinalis TaxID=7719 RepID=UPI000180CE25|nr:dnaJ homolog subfamily C member 11 [Ciona intestinalis]|eukprot:XP_002130372.1 dnaJ homolog subfamily C member 11 [Ciona intestinalis]
MDLPSSGLEELVDNEDFYSLLNASRQASQEDLKSSYRRLCMVYHPDKQSNNREASDIFIRIQEAFNVLSDPTRRHIYDVYGKSGLDADWQLMERRKSPQEMQEEYERIQRIRAQQRLEERTHPEGSFSMSINASSLFDDNQFDQDEYYDDQITLPDITSMSITQSIQAPLSLSHTATLTGNLQSTNGNGHGNLNVSLRKTMSSKMWGEFIVGANDSNSFNLALKGYRSMGGGVFAMVHLPAEMMVDDGVLAVSLPGANFTLGRVLGENLYGSLNLATGSNSHFSTTVVHETMAMRFSAKLQLGIPHSFGMISAKYKMPDRTSSVKVALEAGTFGAIVEYGAEHQMSHNSIVSAHVRIGVPIGVTLKLRLNRFTQTYLIPITLSEEVNPVAAFYGTVAPLLIYAGVHFLIIRPYRRKEKERLSEENEESLVNETKKKKEEAESTIQMMKESTERKIDAEERRMGLVITEAWYGRFVSEDSSKVPKLIDVAIPLQNLVENSKLQLPADITKSGLPGFYDPCPGSDKKLKISYKFRGGLHSVVFDDKEAVRIPLRSHSVTNETSD